MTIFGKNKYNVNFLSLPQQVSKNKIDIENLQKMTILDLQNHVWWFWRFFYVRNYTKR